MKKKTIILIILLLVITIPLIILTTRKKNNGVPRIDIKLDNSLTLKDINDGDKTIKYKNNHLTIDDDTYDITIKGRGHATWRFPKKPYQITFNSKTPLFNYNSKSYVLLANFNDPSLLRNDFTYKVAKKMKMPYTNTGEFIDLYVNKEYIGNYYLMPKISISDSSVDLKSDKAIIMELDNHYYEDETYFITKYFKDTLTIKDRIDDNEEGFNAFKNSYNTMEKNIQKKNYQWLKDNIDLDSFIKYYIITNFSKNPDGFRSSTYFYMDGIDDKIHIGPVWDFDIAYDFLGDNPEDNNIHELDDDVKTSPLFEELLKIEEFQNDVADYWSNTACKIYKEEIKNLDSTIEYLQDSGEKNSDYWNGTSYKRYTDSFKEWINKRYNYFNELYGCK